MKIIFLTLFMFATFTKIGLAQKRDISPIAGWWINTQYEYYKSHSKSEEILYHISPWFIHIDSFGYCTVELLFEQRVKKGYPTITSKDVIDGTMTFQYKNICLYTVKGNDSLLVYRGNTTPPGSGTIFKRNK
jgi:hypothetical protein